MIDLMLHIDRRLCHSWHRKVCFVLLAVVMVVGFVYSDSSEAAHEVIKGKSQEIANNCTVITKEM